MKLFYTVLCFLFVVHVQAQTSVVDSLKPPVELNEVVICTDDKDRSNEAFNFYRSSKISSTEDMMSRMEGVNLIRRGAFGMEPTLRSYSAGQINMMVNGMRMYGACTDKMDPISSYIEPGNLSKLQVHQGAGSSAMGSTVGGSINFELKEASFHCHNKPQVNVYMQYSSVNHATNSGFNLNINHNNIATRLSGAYRKANDYQNGYNQTVKYTAYEKFNINSSTAVKLGQKHTVLLDVIYDKGINIGYPALPMDVSLAEAFIGSLTHRTTIKKWNDAIIESKVYYNTVSHYMDDTKRPETVIHMDMPGWSNTKGFYSKFHYQKGRHLLQLRADGHRAYTRADMTMYPKNEKEMFMQTLPGNYLNNVGISAQYKYQITTKYFAGVNYRQDYFEQRAIDEVGILQWAGFGFDVKKSRSNWLNSLGLNFGREVKKWQSVLTLAHGKRLPTSNERMGFYLFNRADGYDYLGKYDLLPEQALQADFKNTFVFKKVTLGATLFYHHINQYIYAHVINGYSAMTIGARGVKTYRNIDYATLTGFESSVKFRVMKLWYQGNVRYTHGSLSNGLVMQQVPPLKILSALRYQNDSIQIQIEHAFAANQNRINPEFGEIATRNWHTFTARFSYLKKVGDSVFQLNLAVENIFNTYYREHLDWGKIPQPGRNFVVGLNYYLN